MQDEPQSREAADFSERRMLVTGGTRGIGEAIVDRLIRGGGKVFATARSLPASGMSDRFIQADISTREGTRSGRQGRNGSSRWPRHPGPQRRRFRCARRRCLGVVR